PPDCVFLCAKCPLGPGSTLFPYTTLFRSVGLLEKLVQIFRNFLFNYLSIIFCFCTYTDVGLQFWLCSTWPDYYATFLFQYEFQKDRKSTRLHSSHVSISYAVFCLTKTPDH